MTEKVKIGIPSHPKYLQAIRQVTEQVAVGAGFSEIEASRTVLAVDEACSNAMRHSLGVDPSLRLDVTYVVSDGHLEMTVREFGEGGRNYDIKKAKGKDLSAGVTPGGFGIELIKKIMSSVEYSSTPEEGNRLRMIKKVA